MRKMVSVTFVTIGLLVTAILIFSIQFKALWSWMCNNPELTAGFLTSLVLAIGLYFAYRQFKLMNETNRLMKTTEQARLIKDISDYWDSQIMRDGRRALWETKKAKLQLSDELESCKEQDFDKWLELTRVGNFFEEMGNLAHDKAIDLRIIAGRFRTPVTDYYELYLPFIKKHKDTDQPTIYEHFRWLAEEIQKI